MDFKISLIYLIKNNLLKKRVKIELTQTSNQICNSLFVGRYSQNFLSKLLKIFVTFGLKKSSLLGVTSNFFSLCDNEYYSEFQGFRS